MADRLLELMTQRVMSEFERSKHQTCCESGEVIYDCDSKVCKHCHRSIIEYVSEYPGYQIKTDYTFDRFLKAFYEHKWRVTAHVGDNKVQHDFDLFYRAFLKTTEDEPHSFINNLAVYCILRNNNAQCLLSEFMKVKNHKSRKLQICKQILAKLNWNFNFYGYNKDMDKVFEMYEEFKTKVQPIADENRVASQFLKQLDSVWEMQKSSLETEECTCVYVIKKGALKGQICNRKSKSNFCVQHSKRMLNEEQ